MDEGEGKRRQDDHRDFRTQLLRSVWWVSVGLFVQCCFTSTQTTRTIRDVGKEGWVEVRGVGGGQDGYLDFLAQLLGSFRWVRRVR